MANVYLLIMYSNTIPASCRTIGSCFKSRSTAINVGTAAGSCIWPRQYASSCFSSAESSLKHVSIHEIDSWPPMFLNVKRARNLSFSGRLGSFRTAPILWILSTSTIISRWKWKTQIAQTKQIPMWFWQPHDMSVTKNPILTVFWG